MYIVCKSVKKILLSIHFKKNKNTKSCIIVVIFVLSHRKRKFEKGKDGVLCLGFRYVADHPLGEYSVVRLLGKLIYRHKEDNYRFILSYLSIYIVRQGFLMEKIVRKIPARTGKSSMPLEIMIL